MSNLEERSERGPGFGQGRTARAASAGRREEWPTGRRRGAERSCERASAEAGLSW